MAPPSPEDDGRIAGGRAEALRSLERAVAAAHRRRRLRVPLAAVLVGSAVLLLITAIVVAGRIP